MPTTRKPTIPQRKLKEQAKDLEPPKLVSYNMLATLRPDNNSDLGFKITGTLRGTFKVIFTSKAIELNLNSPTLQRFLKIKLQGGNQIKEYNQGTISKGLLYKGYDIGSNDYVEVEYMFGKANDLQSIIVRVSGMAASLMNVPESETGTRNLQDDMLIGSWFMPHNAGITIRFYDNKTFESNEYVYDEMTQTGQDLTIRGIYKFDGKNLVLNKESGQKETCSFYIEKMDGFYRIKRQTKNGYYLYLKEDQVNNL